MTDLELIFSMLGEASTTKVAKAKDAKGFRENKNAARIGGKIAGNAKKELEEESGENIISSENYLPEKKTKELKEKNLTLRSNTHWQVAKVLIQPKPAKEYSCPNTHGQKKLRWVISAQKQAGEKW